MTIRKLQNAGSYITPIEQQNPGDHDTNINVNVSVSHPRDSSTSSPSPKHSHHGESAYSNTPQSSNNLENFEEHSDTNDPFESAIIERPPKTPNIIANPSPQKSNQKYLFSRKKISIPFIFVLSLLIILAELFGEYDGRWRLVFSNLPANTISTITPVPDPMCLHTFVVTTTQDNAPGSFREKVSKAQDGDCVTFASSIKDTIILTDELDIKHSITILGHHPATSEKQATPTVTSDSTDNAIQDDNQTTPIITIDSNSNINISIFPKAKVTFLYLSFRGGSTPLSGGCTKGPLA